MELASLRGEPIELSRWKALASEGNTPEDAVLRKAFTSEVRAVADDERSLEFVITTGRVDREGDVVVPSGGDWGNYFLGGPGPVLLCHDYRSLPVARCASIRTEGEAQVAKAQFPSNADLGLPEGSASMSETVLRMIRGQWGLKSASIGFRPITYEFNNDRGSSDSWHTPVDFKTWEGLEFSIVPVPANPDAHVLMREAGLDLTPIRAWAMRALDGFEDLKVVERDKLEALVGAIGHPDGLKVFDLGADELREQAKVYALAKQVAETVEPESADPEPASDPEPDDSGPLTAEDVRSIVSEEIAKAFAPPAPDPEPDFAAALEAALSNPKFFDDFRAQLDDEFTSRFGSLPA